MVGGASAENAWGRLNSWFWRPNRSILYWTTTIVLVYALAVTVLDVLDINPRYNFKYDPIKGFQGSFTNDDRVYAQADLGLVLPDLPGLKDKMPTGVSVEGSLPVYVSVDRSTTSSKVLARLSSVPEDVVFLVIIWLLRRLALTAVGTPQAPANPFVRINVRRLRTIGLVIMLAPVIDSGSHIAEFELVSRTLMNNWMYWDASRVFLQFGIGFVFFLIAEVFASGIRLREDVEGLV